MIFKQTSKVPYDFEKAFVQSLKWGPCSSQTFRKEYNKTHGQVISIQRMNYYLTRLRDYEYIRIYTVSHGRGEGNKWELTAKGRNYYKAEGII